MPNDPELVPAKVASNNYHFRGKPIPKGRIVKVERSALEAAQRVKPPYLVPAESAGAAEDLPAYEAPVEEASAPAGKKKTS